MITLEALLARWENDPDSFPPELQQKLSKYNRTVAHNKSDSYRIEGLTVRRENVLRRRGVTIEELRSHLKAENEKCHEELDRFRRAVSAAEQPGVHNVMLGRFAAKLRTLEVKIG